MVLCSGGENDAGLCLWDEDRLYRGDRVHEDGPMSNRDDDKRNGYKEVLVPDGDGAEHEESGSGSDGRTSEELVEGVQSLTVDLGGGIEGDEHSNDSQKHSVFAQEV